MNDWYHPDCGGRIMWDLSGGFCIRCHEEGLDISDAEPDLTYVPSVEER